MNKTATSRQALLEAAREIARRDGLEHISIRRTAAMCGVSVGTVYNYYPAKSDLILAVIEDCAALGLPCPTNADLAKSAGLRSGQAASRARA